MKKKFLLMLAISLMLSCLFVISVSAEVTTYDDAPARTNIQVSTDDVVVFDDGFSCPTGYVFKDQSTVNGGRAGDMQYAFDFGYINGKTGKTYSFANIVELDVPQGVTYLGDRLLQDVKTIKKLSIPNTVTSFGVAFCQSATNLEECTFEHDENSSLTSFPTYIFYKTALKAFSMPDCITEIKGEAHFTGCGNLQAVHLSEKLTTWQSGGGGRRVATFDDCYKVFFVNEAFTYDDIPEKPTVYCFPKNLETMTNECIFRECQSLNDILVFGEKLTSAPNAYLFQNGPANNVVFLGDMTTVSTQYWGKTTAIYFANENDVDLNSVSFSGGRKTVFCNAEGNTEHLYLLSEKLEADCENNAKTQTSCFCGKVDASSVVEAPNTALGHDHDYINGKAELLAIVYDDYSKAGTKTVKCGVCGKENSEIVANALFTYKGYSKNDKGSVCVGYLIDCSAITEYQTISGTKLTYGFVAAANNDKPLGLDGNVSSNVIKTDLTNNAYTAVDFILTATDWTAENVASVKLSLNMYIIANNAVKYITAKGMADTAEAKTYSEI